VKKQELLWIEERDVIAIHDRLLALYGGATGLRDRGLLESAPARARQHYTYAAAWDIIELAALYTAGILSNHPFVDGNERTGFVIGVLFLELHGFDFIASEEDATQAVMALATGTLNEGDFAQWMREHAIRRQGR
jgi:death-on-curing protein